MISAEVTNASKAFEKLDSEMLQMKGTQRDLRHVAVETRLKLTCNISFTMWNASLPRSFIAVNTGDAAEAELSPFIIEERNVRQLAEIPAGAIGPTQPR